MAHPFFELRAPSAPWGDYGHILQDGMTCHLPPTSDGVAQLERTGPFVPSISFPGPGDVVVTSEMRQLLEDSGLTGLQWRPVANARIVHLDWHLWDKESNEPLEFPASGEPEDYILDRPHCAATAAALGELWEMSLQIGVTEVRRSGWAGVDASSWTGVDFFRGTQTLRNYVSAGARAWLEDHARSSVAFAVPSFAL